MKKKVIIAVILVLIMVFATIFCTYLFKVAYYQRNFSYSEKTFGNALIGYAPSALEQTVSDDINLLYVDVTWKELEPEKGCYQWEDIEKENQFDRWRSEGKHIVLRFILDYPSTEKHLDIPNWLYESLEDPGDWYNSSSGKGFSPNYANSKLLTYYQKAIEAMGDRWGHDSLISYIELGCLGHWGEWHVEQEAGIRALPKNTVREKYVEPWLSAFPQASILMRRPFTTAKKHHLGLYNDMTGNVESTNEWLDWIESGGAYDQTGEQDLTAMPDGWKTSPIGGEFTSANSMWVLMGRDLQQTISLVKKSHTTFLGPKIAEDINDEKSGYNQILNNMGYRIWISSTKMTKFGKKTRLTMTWKNSGVAPFYKDWKAHVYVKNWAGIIVEKVEVPINIKKILPNESVTVSVYLTSKNVAEATKNYYQISLGIVDPMTRKNAVNFAVKGQENQKELTLFE